MVFLKNKLTNMSFIQKCEIKYHIQSPAKKLTTQYKFCLTYADARGEGSRRTRGEGGQKLAKFCGRLLWMAP